MKKKSKSKEAKFFCESCNSEVPRNSRVCPTCGKFFASVRCPQCGRTGCNDDFKNGCPTCGYAVNPDSLMGGNGSGNIYLDDDENNGLKKKKNGSRDLNIFTNRKKSGYHPESGLPVWVYISTVFVLLILIILLYSCL